jgi:hypothetical protein
MEERKDPLSEIARFQKERKLDRKEYDSVNEGANIMEELLEANGYGITHKVAKQYMKLLLDRAMITYPHKYVSREDMVDAYGDIIVFCVGAIMKLGFDPQCVLSGIAKEINSRRGSFVDGKWEKDKTQNPETLYKANFYGCYELKDDA